MHKHNATVHFPVGSVKQAAILIERLKPPYRKWKQKTKHHKLLSSLGMPAKMAANGIRIHAGLYEFGFVFYEFFGVGIGSNPIHSHFCWHTQTW